MSYQDIKQSFIRSITEVDNTTICWVRVGLIAMLGIFCYGSVDQIISGHFDPMSMATGAAALLAGGGAGIGFKSSTEKI